MKYLTNIDMCKNELLNARIQNLAADPSSPAEGQLYFNTVDHTLYVFTGEQWVNALFLYTLTVSGITEVLGFTPRQIDVGTDGNKGAATGSKKLYVATDTKKIWLDNAQNTWLQVGGQDTIAWTNITGKPSAFNPPVASSTVLGGIKVGNNLTIEEDGTLSAVVSGGDGEHVYLVKQQRYTAAADQTTFTITNGQYQMGAGLLSVFLNGAKISGSVITELSNTSFQIPAVPEGTTVLAEYVQIMATEPYLSHGQEHTENGVDAIPNATTSEGGLMGKTDKGRLDNLYKRIAGYAVTAGSTSAYTVSITGAALNKGTLICVRFHAANATNATLNLNSLGAKPIYYKGAAVPAGRAPVNSVVLLVYDTEMVSGGAWHMVYSYDSNTTYSKATASSDGLLRKEDFAKLAEVTLEEMEYLSGVTSGIQEQLNGKALKNHTHNYAGSSSAGGAATSAAKLNRIQLTAQDLDDYHSGVNFYYAGGGNTCANKPAGVDNFGMFVFQTAGGWFTQILYGSDDDMYMRRWVSDSWTSWAKVYTTANKPTASDIGAAAVSHTHSQYAESLSDLGVTATAAELNKLDGATVSTEEINYLDGVTSNIQNQLNGKAATSHGNHVPTAETANARRFLRNDNTWQTLPASSTFATGIVQLNDNINSTSVTQAATANAVKKAYDKGNHSHPYISTSQKGAAGGVAELDDSGKVPSDQLPSYVDDVIEYEDVEAFPETGESGKIYVDTTTNKTYRWGGTSYVEISASLALGETSSTAYRGDRGKVAYDHSLKTSGNPHNVKKSDVGLGNVPNVATNDQTPTFTAASTLANLVSGEKLSVAMGKIAKAVSGLISHLADTTKHITASERTSWNSRARKYVAGVGNGSATEFTLTHNLGTRDITVFVRETASPYNQVICDIQIPNTTQVKILFASAPASGAYRVIVTG